MYVQYKNYSLGKTTHERFSKRAALAQKAIESVAVAADEVDEEETSEKLLSKDDDRKLNKKKRGCCTNFKGMMYTKERPT